MFNTFHVAKDVDAKTLVETTIHSAAIGSPTGQWFGVAGFKEEDISTSVFRT